MSRSVARQVLVLLAVVSVLACERAVPTALTASQEPLYAAPSAPTRTTTAVELRIGATFTLTPHATHQRTRLVRWSSSAPEVAPVNNAGLVQGAGVGDAVVTAESPAGLERFPIRVVAPPPDQSTPVVVAFSIEPKTGIALAPGALRQFNSTATWSDGQPRGVSVTYSATGGTISPTGLFTAGSLAGTVLVIANCACGRADTAAVIVTAAAPQLAALRISPKSVSAVPGESVQFQVQATWSTGATTLPPLAWSSSGGSVSATGRYTAPTSPGSYRVVAAHSGGSLRDTAIVTVVSTQPPPPPTGANAACPNEPSAYALYGDVVFNNTIPPAGFGFDGRREVLADASAPYHPTSLVFRFLQGQANSGTGSFGTNAFPAPFPRAVFACVTFRQSSNFQQHPVGLKFFYPYTTTADGGSFRTYTFGLGKDGQELRNGRFRTGAGMQSGDPDSYPENRPLPAMETGTWYRLEHLAVQNTPGVKNGLLKWWTSRWNGVEWEAPVLRGEYSNVLYSPAGWPGTWRSWVMNLHFGGQGGGPIPEEQFVFVNRFYISTAP